MSTIGETTRRHVRWAQGTALALILGVMGATPVTAQGLEALFDRAANAPTATDGENADLSSELQRQIDARMRAISDSLSTPVTPPADEDLTVEDLDQLQRQANRASSAQALQDARNQAIRDEIELLLFLQTSLREIQEMRGQNGEGANGAMANETPPVDVEALRAQWEAEQAAEAAASEQAAADEAKRAEQAAIPRLAMIKGGAGVWEAEVESVRGVMQYVRAGDALADGFKVESIDSTSVIVQGASGNRYTLIPSPPLPANAQNGTPVPAQNIATMGQVF